MRAHPLEVSAPPGKKMKFPQPRFRRLDPQETAHAPYSVLSPGWENKCCRQDDGGIPAHL